MDKMEMLNYNLLQQVKNGTKIVMISGASSSGKSYLAYDVKQMLEENGYNPVIVSTDAFYKNISQIVMEQFLETNYNFLDKTDLVKVYKIIDKHTINKTFTEKFTKANCKNIFIDLCSILTPSLANKVVKIYEEGIEKINFDTPNAVNLSKCAKFCNDFFKNNSVIIPKRNFAYSVNNYLNENKKEVTDKTIIILEGIYALNNNLIQKIKPKSYRIYVDSDLNTILVRRFNRDILLGRSTMAKEMVIENFLQGTMPGYLKYTYPTRENAHFIYDNSYSKLERISNAQTSQIKFIVKNIDLTDYKKIKSVMQKDFYLNPTVVENANEVVRIREENGKVKDITHKSENKNDNTFINRPEQKFDLQDVSSPKLRNSVSICSMFVNAGYSFAGTVKKNRTYYQFEDVNFCLDTFTDGSQVLEIQSGSSENINKLVKQLDLNIIQTNSYYVSNFVSKGVEKEIKVKLNNLPACCNEYSRIEQTYLKPSVSKLFLASYLNFPLESFSEIRVRKQNNDYFLTLKSKDVNNRQEKEFLISKSFAKKLLKFKQSKTIIKNRYLIKETSNFKLEIDKFLNLEMPLVLAEVEYACGTEQTANMFLRKYVNAVDIDKDVTSDVSYKNSHLCELVKEEENEQTK